MAHEIVVVDYHKGNLLSVARSASAVGAEVVVSDDPRTISEARGIILPGVGSFEDAMSYLRRSGEADAIVSSVRKGVPFLGICLGMQLLFDRGDECTTAAWGNGWVPGLGLVSGSVSRLHSGRLKVPHVGWDQLHLTAQGRICPLLVDAPEGSNVYFTHSYAVADDVDPKAVIAYSHYTRTFASAIWQDNIFGVQFHPEKSSSTGLQILSNFLNYVRG